jgi:putative tributyrin esterase
MGTGDAETNEDVAAKVMSSELNPKFDPNSLADKIAAEGRKFPKCYIACGAKDFLYKANQEFRDKLIKLGADVTWDETAEHGHEWRFWNLEIEKFLDWLPRTDVYSIGGAKRQI